MTQDFRIIIFLEHILGQMLGQFSENLDICGHLGYTIEPNLRDKTMFLKVKTSKMSPITPITTDNNLS